MTDAEKDYLFDLNGYLVLDNALSAEQLRQINAWIDAQKQHPAKPGDWLGDVHVHTYGGSDGTNYQNIVEGGPVFEELIDNPTWIAQVRRYIENDYNKVGLNEDFLNIRGQGGYIGIHSGGYLAAPCMTFRHHTGRWSVGQINILMALQDVGPGDGCTVVVPGSHKSHELHPVLQQVNDPNRANSVYRTDKPEGTLGAIEVRLKAGQALMFTDSILHGGSSRINPGERRILIYRYSPHTLMQRYNYLPSDALKKRLTPGRLAILNPVPVRMRPGRIIQGA